MVKVNWITTIGMAIVFFANPLWAKETMNISLEKTNSSILTLQSVLERVEKGHPLLKGSRTEKLVASGKLLKAMGQFEPSIVNDYELERLAKNGGTTASVGFNDTFVEMKHPWGIKGFAGFRAGIGSVEVADLDINDSNQPLLGIVFPLLRGLITNPEHAELKKSSLAEKQAKLEIQQTRQDLYLGAATQYWNWVSAWKSMDLQKKAVKVAEDRLAQLTAQAKVGARAKFDVIEGEQEVQQRKDKLIKAKRKVDQEQFKLALFLWENDSLIVPNIYKAPVFPQARLKYSLKLLEEGRRKAAIVRPELKLIDLEAEFNNIDMEVAENNLLPDLNVEVQPTRKPGEFVLGLGYRFGVQLSIPFYQRKARGELLQMSGKAKRLKYKQRFRLKKIMMDVENAHSAVVRAAERIKVSQEALLLAKKLEKGERTRFKLGATSLLIVNLRERNVIKAAEEWISAKAEHQKALALFKWSIGEWVKGPVIASIQEKKKKEATK